MSRKRAHYHYQLDSGGISSLSDDEIVAILRAADPIIANGGRTLLSKVLKGSKDKDVLNHSLDVNPFYGAFANKPSALIMNMIDYCILDDLFRIQFDGRMPVLVYSEKGWAIERETFANELLLEILDSVKTGSHDFIEHMLKVNPQCVLIALNQLGKVNDAKLREALAAWLPQTNGKVKKKINFILSQKPSVSPQP